MDALPEPFPENYYVEIPCPGAVKPWGKQDEDQSNAVRGWSRFEEGFQVVRRRRLPSCCHPAFYGLAEEIPFSDAWGMYSSDVLDRRSKEKFTFREFRCTVNVGEAWDKVEVLRDLMMREAQMIALLNQNTEKLSVIAAAWLEQRIRTDVMAMNETGPLKSTPLIEDILQHISKHAPFLAMIPNFLEDSDTSDSEVSEEEDKDFPDVTSAEPKSFSIKSTPNIQCCYTPQPLEVIAYIQMDSNISFDDWLHRITKKNEDHISLMDLSLQKRAMLHAFFQMVEQVEAIHCEGLVHLHLCKHNIYVSAQSDDLTDTVASVGALAFLSRPGKRERSENYHNCEAFCSPELKAGKQCDSHSDIFSLGIIFLHMICFSMGFGSELTDRVLKEANEGFHCPPTIINEYSFEGELIESLIKQDSFERLECFEILSLLAKEVKNHS